MDETNVREHFHTNAKADCCEVIRLFKLQFVLTEDGPKEPDKEPDTETE